MYKKHNSLLTALLLVSSFNVTALGINGSQADFKLILKDDYMTAIVGEGTATVRDVSINDVNGENYTIEGSRMGTYGWLSDFKPNGQYTYELFDNTTNESLPDEETATDRFEYTAINDKGYTATAWIIVDIRKEPLAPPEPVTPPVARDDSSSAIPNEIPTITGDVTTNDTNGDYVELISSPSSDYGVIVLQSDGSYTYAIYETASSIIDLKTGDVVTDEFDYKYLSNSGKSSTATLTIQIIGNQVDGNGDTVFENPDDQPYENVDVEFNNRSAQATSLHSGRNILGHLYQSGDKDWYALASAGDEIITLEVCPKGTSCFEKKSWVLYVFDSDLLTKEMEERKFTFTRWLNETGTIYDESGEPIIDGNAGQSNHMYLAYRSGFFEGALIGIVDPCFDTLNSVDIGVGEGARNYLIAISSPLKGDADTNAANSCGQGSVVLEKPGRDALGAEAPTTIKDDEGNIIEVDGKVKTYSTTEEYISVTPNSDDQYAIKITGTGINPLLSDEAAANSSFFDLDTNTLDIPKVRIDEKTFQTTLTPRLKKARSADDAIEFIISDFEDLGLDKLVDAYRATFNPENSQVLIPRVTVKNTNKAYSVILQYHASTNGDQAWLEVISATEIK